MSEMLLLFHVLSLTWISSLSVYPSFLDSPAKSPRKSPFKPSMVTSSFYGKQKPIYLTPLERKAVKESLPSSSPPLPPSPPSQKKKKNKKNVKGGSKPRKVAAGSRNAGKTGLKSYTTSTKPIKLPKLGSRFVCFLRHRPVRADLLVLLQLSDTIAPVSWTSLVFAFSPQGIIYLLLRFCNHFIQQCRC